MALSTVRFASHDIITCIPLGMAYEDIYICAKLFIFICGMITSAGRGWASNQAFVLKSDPFNSEQVKTVDTFTIVFQTYSDVRPGALEQD